MGAEVEKLVRVQHPAAFGATLYTVGLDGVRTVCLRWQGPFADPNDLIEQVEERAQRQANALGGVHAFLLELVDSAAQVLGTEFFRVSAETWTDGRSVIAEPANEGGMLAQMMRHNEAIMRTGVQGSEKTLQAAHKMIDQTARRAEYAEGKFLEMLSKMYELLTGERETQVALVKAEARAVATKQIAGKIASLIPEISAAFLSGVAGPKGAAHAAAVSAKGLFSDLTQEQLKGILSFLRPEQQMQLFGLMQRLAAEHEQQQKKEASDLATAEGNGIAKH